MSNNKIEFLLDECLKRAEEKHAILYRLLETKIERLSSDVEKLTIELKKQESENKSRISNFFKSVAPWIGILFMVATSIGAWRVGEAMKEQNDKDQSKQITALTDALKKQSEEIQQLRLKEFSKK